MTGFVPEVRVEMVPEGPETVQLETSFELQVMVEVPPPLATRGGTAEMVALGDSTVTGLK